MDLPIMTGGSTNFANLRVERLGGYHLKSKSRKQTRFIVINFGRAATLIKLADMMPH